MLPLEGIKVLEFTEAYSGPLTASMLGDMGAEVIKVERLQGESIRRGRASGMWELDQVTQDEVPLDAPQWLITNRSKRSLAIDIRQDEGREIIINLIKKTDVFMENFRPGVMDRLGFAYNDISKINPKIIYASLSGYGEKGPFAHRIGGDPWIQAMTGVVSRQGEPNSTPFLAAFSFVDMGNAAILAYGIMVALFVRERTGMGQRLTTNLLHSSIQLQLTEMSEYLIGGELVTKIGRSFTPTIMPPPAGTYRAKDGDVMTILGSGPQWPRFCQVLGLPHLASDPRFATDEERAKHRDELYPLLENAFTQKTRDEWQQLFRTERLRCDPCLTYAELFAHPQVEANDIVTTIDHPVQGKLKMPGLPVTLSNTPGHIQSPPPVLGQHTEEILEELGYTPEKISDLERMGIVKATLLNQDTALSAKPEQS